MSSAIDLAIDFATLGEYGLEPAGGTGGPCAAGRARPLPIADRTTFTEVLFPNRCGARHRGPQGRGGRGVPPGRRSRAV
ncbi:MAG: hypothetical protein ACM3NV_03690 [Syntrophothermus sp.]